VQDAMARRRGCTWPSLISIEQVCGFFEGEEISLQQLKFNYDHQL